jgi:uncharacterized membrane protein
MGLSEKPGAPSRAQRGAQLLARAAPAVAEWRREHAVDFYLFGGADRPAADHPAAASDLQPASEERLSQAPPVGARGGDATRIREALTALRSRYEGRDLGGVVLISDGIDNGRFAEELSTDGDALDAEGRDFLRSLDAPVHTAWTGEPGLRDVAIARLLADDFAFARNVVKVEAVIRVRGARAAGWVGQRLPVTLRRDGQLVRTVELFVDPDKPEQKATFEFTPDRVGKYLYEVSVPPPEGDAIPENNARVFSLKVIRDKIRVLLVSGRPSWDERFLRGLLKHNPNVDLISFFILRTPDDVEAVSPDELSLIPFPTEELFQQQLRSFDVVFLQNFDYAPYGIGAYLNEIRNYVFDGGGLAMIGGERSFTSGGYAHTPVADVLPVELRDPAPEDQLVALDPFRMKLTTEGRGHPITALRLEARENGARWDALPSLEGANLVEGARPGATVLGAHPFLKGGDGKPLPILAVTDVGKGRTLAFASDSSWRWGFGALASGGDRRADDDADARGRDYQRFWENAIRWLVRDPELRLLRVEADRRDYPLGEKVRLELRALDPDYRPARGLDVALNIARSTGTWTGATRTVRTDDNGEASVELEPLPPGGYRVTAKAQRKGADAALAAASQDEEVFVVRGATRELEDAEARDGLLRAVAEASGGRFLGVAPASSELASLPFQKPQVIRVNQHRDLELWSTWLTLAAAALFLSAEWWIRRRTGMP